ncbi:hypothetical protein BDR03DRAFT_960089 [Suillus americanus]|nr:hypothetical protein BDR03DRAFT_960089 [Suillus americanus]
MAVTPSNLQTREHALPKSGTWTWHRQRPVRTSKHDITHNLRAGHGRGTVNVA